MRIAFLIHELGPGGAERVLVHLANGLTGRGHEVTIHTLNAKPDSPFYPLDTRVRHIPLGLHGLPRRTGLIWTLRHVVRLVLNLRQHLRNEAPEILVPFIDTTNIFALLAAMGLPLPVVVSERSDPRQAPLRWIWRALRQLTYPRATALVVQSAEVRAFFPFWVRRKTVVIPNPVPPPPSQATCPTTERSRRRMIAVGRLGPEKGFDLLLEAFAQVAAKIPAWELEIWGEGPERNSLEAIRNRLGLTGRVRFPGTTTDIHARYAQADLFVLSSRFEGFPNALCEAMSHAMPVVATSCSGGVRDIIRPNLDGFLVPPEDVPALARALGQLMDDPKQRAALGQEAKRVIQRFGPEQVLDAWEECLKAATHGRISEGTGTTRHRPH